MSTDTSSAGGHEGSTSNAKLSELTRALEQPIQDVSSLLEQLLSLVAKGEQPTATWETFHTAVARDRLATDLEGFYAKFAQSKAVKLLTRDQQAYVFLRVQGYYQSGAALDQLTEATERALECGADVSLALSVLEKLPAEPTFDAARAKLFLTASAHANDVQLQRSLLERAAALADALPGGVAVAVEAYQRILRSDPQATLARSALVNHLMALGKPREAAKLLEQALQQEPAPASELLRNFRERVMELYVGPVREPARAIQHVEALLVEEPRHERARAVVEGLLDTPSVAPRATAALSDAFEKAGELRAAAAMLTRELQMARGPRRTEVQRRLAILRQDELKDAPGALELLTPAVAADASDDELRRRYVQLSREVGQAGEATRLLSRGLRAARDAAAQARIGTDLGVLYLSVADVPRAQAAFEQVVAALQDDTAVLEAARQLVRIHTESGNRAGLLEALFVVVERESQLEERQRAARQLVELCAPAVASEASDASSEPAAAFAHLDERQTTLAVCAWRTLIGSAFTDEALANLENHYRARQLWPELVDVLEQRSARSNQPDEARALAVEAAQLRARHFDDAESALAAWRAIAEKFGPSRQVNLQLIPLLERAEQWEELARRVEDGISSGEHAERVVLWAKLAELKLGRLNDAKGALEAFQQALALEPADVRLHRASMALLQGGSERLAAVEMLEPIFRANAAQRELLVLLEVKGELAPQAADRLAALDEALGLMAQAAGGAADELVLSGLAQAEQERLARFARKGLAVAISDVPAAIEVWLGRFERVTLGEAPEQRAETLLQLLAERPIDSRELSLVAQLASDAFSAAKQPERALALLRTTLELAPPSAALLERIDALLAAHGTPEERVRVYQAALTRENDAARRAAILRAMAQLQHDTLADATAAVATWQLLLREMPRDVGAHRALVTLYSELGRREEAYQEIARALPYADAQERSELLLSLARLALASGNQEKAAEHCRALMGQGTLSADVLEAIDKIAEECGDARTVQRALERRLALLDDPRQQAALLERLGDVFAVLLNEPASAVPVWRRGAELGESDAVRDYDRAARLYLRVLEVSTGDVEAAEHLLGLYAKQGAWERLTTPFRALAEACPPARLVAILLALKDGLPAAGIGTFVELVDTALSRGLDKALARELTLAKAELCRAEPARQDQVARCYRELIEMAAVEVEADAERFEVFLAQCELSDRRIADRRWLFQWRLERVQDKAPVLEHWAEIEEKVINDLAAASRLYQDVVERYPARTAAWRELVRLYGLLDNVEAAATALAALRERLTGAERVTVELELATLLMTRKQDSRAALAIATKILHQDPTHAAALDFVTQALARPEAEVLAAEILENTADLAVDPGTRARIIQTLLAAATASPELASGRGRWIKVLLETKSDTPQEGFEIALRGAEQALTDEALWLEAERFARLLEKPAPMVEGYERALGRSPSPEVVSLLGRRLVEFFEEWFDEEARVVALLDEIFTRCPSAHWAYERLKLAHSTHARWPELFTLHDRAIAHTSDPNRVVDLLREAAMTARDFAGDHERAIRYLEQLIELRPRDTRAESSLERLYERYHKRRALIELLMRRLDNVADADRVSLQSRIATLWLDENDAVRALRLIEAMRSVAAADKIGIDLLERLLSLVSPKAGAASEDATSLSVQARAVELLKAHYQATWSMHDVVRMLEIEVTLAPNKGERIKRLNEVVRTRLEELDDVAGAFENMTDLVRLAPAVPEYRARLAELAEPISAFERQAELLVAVGDAQTDIPLRLNFLSEAARVYKTQLRSPARAIEIFLRVLDLAGGDHETVLRAARELNPMLREAERPLERCSVLERMAELEKPKARKAALGEVARVALGTLQDYDRAVRAWRARLQDDAEDIEALDGLCESLESARRFDELVVALETRANLLNDNDLRRRDWTRMARVHAIERRDAAAAIAVWRRIRGVLGGDIENFEALAELFSTHASWAELGELIADEIARESDGARRTELLQKGGAIWRDRTAEPLKALRAFADARDWKHAEAVVAAIHAAPELAVQACRDLFERAVEVWKAEGTDFESAAARTAGWAAEELCQRLLQAGDVAGAVDRLLVAAGLPFEQTRQRELKQHAAFLATERLHDAARAVALLAELFQENARDAIASASVGRFAELLLQEGKYRELADLWEQQARLETELGQVERAAAFWAKAALVAEERLADLARAVQDHRQAAALRGVTSLRALARIHAGRGEHRRAAEVLEWLCTRAPDESLGDDTLRLADEYVQAGETLYAQARLEAASAVLPDKRLRTRLADLYRQAENWPKLAATLAAEVERTSDAREQLALLVEAARLQVEACQAPLLAVPLLERAVELAPSESRLRLALADTLRRAAQFDRAALTLRAQIEQYGGRRPKERAVVHFRLAQVLLDAGRKAEAVPELELAAKVDPTRPVILQQMAQLALEEGDLTRAERTFGSLLMVALSPGEEDCPSRAETFLALGDIARARNDLVRAMEFVESAFEAALDDPREALALERVFVKAGNNELLARALEARLENAPNAEAAAAALADLVKLHSDVLGDMAAVRERLTEHARSVQAQLHLGASRDDKAWAGVGEIFRLLGEPLQELRVLEQRVDVWREAGGKPTDAEPFYRLAEMRVESGSDHEEIIELLERALDVRTDVARAGGILEKSNLAQSGSERALKLLERVTRAADDRAGLARVLAALVGLPGPRGAAMREGIELAKELGDVQLIEAIVKSALEKSAVELSPEDDAWARLELAEVYSAAKKWRVALQLKEQAAAGLPKARAREVLLEVAQAALEKAEDLPWSCKLYEALLQGNPADRRVWEPLLDIYRRSGARDRLTRLLERTAHVVDSPDDLARLQLERAQLLLDRPGQSKAAAALLTGVLAQDPAQTQVAGLLADILEKSGRQSELLDLLKQQLTLAQQKDDPARIVSASVRLGALLERLGQNDEALALYRSAHQRDPRNIEILMTVLRLAKVAGDTGLAAEATEGLLEVEDSKRSGELAMRLVKLRDKLKDPEGALKALRLALNANPENEKLRELYLARLMDAGRGPEVAELLRGYCSAAPADAALLERMVEAHRATDDRPTALALIEQLLEQGQPQAEQALRRERTTLLVELGRGDEALADLEHTYRATGTGVDELVDALERAVNRTPSAQDYELAVRLIEVFYQIGDKGAAHARGRQLLEVRCDNKVALRNVARLQSAADDWDGAEATLRALAALEAGPELALTARHLYSVAKQLSSPDRAKATLERALEENPQDDAVRNALTELYENAGHRRELAQLLVWDAEKASDPGKRHELLMEAGKSLLECDEDAALHVFEQARGVIPDHIEGGLLLARCYTARQRGPEALDLLENVAAAYGGRRLKELGLIYQEICSIQLEDGFLTDAVEALGRACEMEPKNSALAMRLGKLALEVEENDVATRAFRSVAVMKRSDHDGPEGATLAVKADAHYQLALLAQKEGDPRKAKILLSKALTEHPEHRAAKALLEQLQ